VGADCEFRKGVFNECLVVLHISGTSNIGYSTVV